MKKITCLITVLMMTALSVVGCGSDNNSSNDKGLKITMVTSVGGVTDGSFNQSAWEGQVETIEQACEVHGLKLEDVLAALNEQ